MSKIASQRKRMGIDLHAFDVRAVEYGYGGKG
jgi:hypothetical protein